MKDTFLMIDGNSLLHRAFHALPLMDAGGVYTNAIYGFLTMMLKAISDENARYLAVCFDEHAPTFRHTAYPDYKAGRAATPDELRQQFATIRTLLPEMGIQVFSLQGWEADDLLGTLSKLGEDAGVSPVILTGDRDALQLVSDTTQVLFTRKGISETTHFTPAMVYEVYGFSPEQVVDWKGLAGDSSDNIPGIPALATNRRAPAAPVWDAGQYPRTCGRSEGQTWRKARHMGGSGENVPRTGDDSPRRTDCVLPQGVRHARLPAWDSRAGKAEAEQHHPPPASA